MALRPGRTIKRKKRPWSRVSKKKPRKSYVVGVPYPRIHVFNMGNKDGSFDRKVYLISKDDVQIRDNALESARIVTQKYLEKRLGKDNYFFKILIYPHNVIREKSIATGAGADRYSRGMKLAFGRPSGKSAVVKSGQNIFLVSVDEKNVDAVKEALRRASTKIRCRTKIEVVE